MTNKIFLGIALLVFTALLIMLIGFRSIAEITPNPEGRYLINKQLDLGEFNSIKCGKGEWRIYIEKSDSCSAIISGGENLINNFVFAEIHGDTLNLDIKEDFKYFSIAEVILRINMPDIGRIKLTGSSNLRILDSSFPLVDIDISDYTSVLVDSCSIDKVNIYASGHSGIKFYGSRINGLNFRMHGRSNLLSDNEVKNYDGELTDTSYANIGGTDLISEGIKNLDLKLNIIPGLVPYKNERYLDSLLTGIGARFLTDTIRVNTPIPVNFESNVRKSELLSYTGGQIFNKHVKYWNFFYTSGKLSQVTLFFNATDNDTYSHLLSALEAILPDSTKVEGIPDYRTKPAKIDMWGFRGENSTHSEIVSLEQDHNSPVKLNYSIIDISNFRKRIDSHYIYRYSADRIWEMIYKRAIYGFKEDFVNPMIYGY